MRIRAFSGIALGFMVLGLLLAAAVPSASALTFESEEMGSFTISGKIQAAFGATQYLDFVDGPAGRALDSDFDATRELALKFEWSTSEYLKAVASFQIGEGSTGGYFGSTDALVGGEEDGDLILELDNLYFDFTVPDTDLNFKVGSQSAVFADLIYGSHLMYEVPAGVDFTMPFNDMVGMRAAWFRMTDLMDDTETNMDDQADLFYLEAPVKVPGFSISPYAAFANIQEDVVRNAPSHFRYAYLNYPGLLQGTLDSLPDRDSVNPTDAVTAYYLGMALNWDALDPLRVRATATWGDMDWETDTVDANIAGYFADLVVDYKMDKVTPEFFAFYGNGPDRNDEDMDMLPVLIGGPTYTTSYFGGSRYNDNMFDSHDSLYAVSMWAAGFKLKDIHLAKKLTNEFQIMYAEGTAEGTIFQAPYDMLMNEDESFVEVNFNTEYEIIENFVGAVELGYITFDEDSDYDEAANGTVEDFWKVAFSLEYTF
jgi:hypothetical protein